MRVRAAGNGRMHACGARPCPAPSASVSSRNVERRRPAKRGGCPRPELSEVHPLGPRVTPAGLAVVRGG